MITALIIAGVVLFGLGATTGHLVHEAERIHPPAGRFVSAGGLRQHVIELGKADDGGKPAIVMIHGAYGAAGDFAASLMPAVADDFHAIAIDRPGHGYTERGGTAPLTPAQQAAYLHAALQELKIERPILLGFSYGGAVALAYALEQPEAVSALVLVSPASHPWRNRPDMPFGMADIPLVGPLLTHTIVTPTGHLLKDRGISSVFGNGDVPEEFINAPVSLSLRPGSYAANAEDIRILNDFLQQQAPQYPSLRMPVVIVASENDPSVSADIHARALARDIAGAKLLISPDGGHPLHFSKPELVLEAIRHAAIRAR